MAGSGTGIVIPYATHRGMRLDGALDYYSRADPAGIADGPQGTISIWFRIDAGDGLLRYILWNQGTRFQVSLTAANFVDVQGRAAGGGGVFQMTTNVTYLAGSGWHHVLASWNATTSTQHIYIDGAVPGLGVNGIAPGNIDYTRGLWQIGASAGPASLFAGALSEMYFHPVYIDLSNETNRELWRHPNGQPPSIGADGSGPLGVQPLIYMAEVTSVFTNLGSGGAFAIAGGAPTLSANTPKDRWLASLRHWQRRRKSAA